MENIGMELDLIMIFVKRKIIKILIGVSIVKKVMIPNKEPSFIIADSIFRKFVLECLNLKESLITLRFNLIWKNLRNPSPLEREYYELYNGKRRTDGVFNKVTQYLRDKRVENKNNLDYRKYKKEKQALIESIDNHIYNIVSNIKTKYKAIFKKYSPIMKMYFDVVYPLFLQQEIEKTMKKQINVDGKWIKKPYHGITMITPWGRRTEPPSPDWF